MPEGALFERLTTLLQAAFLSVSKRLSALGITEQYPSFPAAQGNSGKKIESGPKSPRSSSITLSVSKAYEFRCGAAQGVLRETAGKLRPDSHPARRMGLRVPRPGRTRPCSIHLSASIPPMVSMTCPKGSPFVRLAGFAEPQRLKAACIIPIPSVL